MSRPEDIPEDDELSYPCPNCHGSVTLQGSYWCCDTCAFMATDKEMERKKGR